MRYKTIIFAVLLMGILVLAACTQRSTGYATYNPQQGGNVQQQPYVGGGCGVAPVDNIEDRPINTNTLKNSL